VKKSISGQRLHCGLVFIGLALIIPAISCLPGCDDKPGHDISSSPTVIKTIVVPSHHWAMSMTEEQLDLLKNCWGNEMTILELSDLLWPEVVDIIPEHMVNCWNDNKVYWSTSDLSDLIEGSIPSMSLLELMNGIELEGSYRMYALYIGLAELEASSMRIDDSLNVTPENSYRVSLYTDGIYKKGGNEAKE